VAAVFALECSCARLFIDPAAPKTPPLPNNQKKDLACGVFDVRSGAALAAAERAIQAGPLEAGGGGGGSGSGSCSDSETSSSYDDGDDADSDDGGDNSSGGGEQGEGGAAAKGGSNGSGGENANPSKKRGGLKPPRKKLIQELPPKQE
jgi:hypothetical protein